MPSHLQNSQDVRAQRSTRDHRLTLLLVKPRSQEEERTHSRLHGKLFSAQTEKALELTGQQPGPWRGPQPWHWSAEWLSICCFRMHHPDKIAATPQAFVQPRESSRMGPGQAGEGVECCCFCCSRPCGPCRERVAMIETRVAIY